MAVQSLNNIDVRSESQGRQKFGLWLGIVIFVAIAERVFLWLAYQSVPYSDTPSYRRLAEAILNGWDAYDGTRTPGYPFFLALIGPNERVWLVQLILGLVITLLFFYLGWQVSQRAWIGGVMALAHTLNLGQLFFEANLLTETLTTFWITLAIAGVAWWLYHPRHRSIWLAGGLGAAAALALLTRPLFIYLPLWILLFLPDGLRITRAEMGKVGANVAAFLVPVILLAGGWVGFIHNRYGVWSLTTMTGYHLVQHTGVFFEYVPDEEAALRDTYLKYRNAHIAQYGTQANSIWEAIPEMQEASGLGFYELSRELARISVDLIQAHPDLFLKNIIDGWIMFWRAPVYWSPEVFQSVWMAGVTRFLILIERVALVILNGAFVVLSIFGLVLKLGHRAPPRLQSVLDGLTAFDWFVIGTIWLASILQTLLDHGDNPRFLIPLQSLVVFWVLWTVWRGRAVLAQQPFSARGVKAE